MILPRDTSGSTSRAIARSGGSPMCSRRSVPTHESSILAMARRCQYDALLLALGARPEPALPGAVTFAGPRDVLAVKEAIQALRHGRRHRLAFVATSGVAWTLPLYELALMTAAHGRRLGLDLQLELVTRESDPLDVFGAAASAAVARRLIAAGVNLRTGTFAQEYADGRAVARARRAARGRPRDRAPAPPRPAPTPDCRTSPTVSRSWTRTAACAGLTGSGPSET